MAGSRAEQKEIYDKLSQEINLAKGKFEEISKNPKWLEDINGDNLDQLIQFLDQNLNNQFK